MTSCTSPTTTTYYEVSVCSVRMHSADTGVVLEAPTHQNDPKRETAWRECRDIPQLA